MIYCGFQQLPIVERCRNMRPIWKSSLAGNEAVLDPERHRSQGTRRADRVGLPLFLREWLENKQHIVVI